MVNIGVLKSLFLFMRAAMSNGAQISNAGISQPSRGSRTVLNQTEISIDVEFGNISSNWDIITGLVWQRWGETNYFASNLGRRVDIDGKSQTGSERSKRSVTWKFKPTSFERDRSNGYMQSEIMFKRTQIVDPECGTKTCTNKPKWL